MSDSSSSEKTEIRFTVDSKFLKELQERLGVERATEVTRSALTLLDWATSEAGRGRLILSSTEKGDEIHRLVMPELSQAKSSRQSGT